MNRILFEKEEIRDGVVEFSDFRAEHVLNVLHGAPGVMLKTGEVDGLLGTSEIIEIRGLHEREAGSPQRGNGLLAGTVVAKCTHDAPSKAPWFDLVLAPPRPRAFKRLLPQLAALGVGKIVLVGAGKVEKSFWGAQALKEPVYRPLLLDGLMQSGTSVLPEVRCERNFREYAQNRLVDEFADCEKIVAHPDATNAAMARAENGEAGRKRTVIAIGPEGGWLESEVETLERLGFVRYSLGGRILRTDTAAIAVIAQLMASRDVWD